MMYGARTFITVSSMFSSAWMFRSIGLDRSRAEDTHNGLCVDNVSSGNQVEVSVELGQVIYERLYLIDGV